MAIIRPPRRQAPIFSRPKLQSTPTTVGEKDPYRALGSTLENAMATTRPPTAGKKDKAGKETKAGAAASRRRRLLLDSGGAGDTYWDNTVLLVSGEEGIDLAQTFTDSTGRHTVDGTRAIGTSISELSTEQAKFGTQSMKVFDDIGGGNDSGFNVADGADFDFTTDNPDFTVEFHRYTPNISGTAIATIGQWQIAAGGYSWKISVLTNADPGTSSSITVNVSTDGSTSNLTYTFNGLCTLAPIKANTWAHIALVRDGNTARIFVDGTQIETEDWTGLVLHNSTYDFAMGTAAQTQGSSDDVYLDNVRVTKGVARYTEDFTPPTEAFPTS